MMTCGALRVLGGGSRSVASFLHNTVSCTPRCRQLMVNSMSRWRVAGGGSRIVRSFLHTAHEKGAYDDEGLWHQRQLALVVDVWRERNNGAEPSAENLQEMSSLLKDLTRMHSAQNGGALPADADVRAWFGTSASEDIASVSNGKHSAAAAAEGLKLPHEFSPSEWQAELARRRDPTATAASDTNQHADKQTVARETAAQQTDMQGADTALVYTKLLVMALHQAMQQIWNVARQTVESVSAQQHITAVLANDSDEASHADATACEWPAYWEVESAAPDMHHSFLRIRCNAGSNRDHISTTGEPVGYISKSAPLEQLRTYIVCCWADGHIQDPMLDIKFAHDYAGGTSSEEQLELLDKSTDSGAALLCKQDPDAPGSHSCGRDGFSLGSLRIIVRGQVTPVFISDDLLQSSSFVSWAAIRNIRNNQEIRKLGRDAIGTAKGMLLLFAVAFVIKVTN